MSNDVIMICVQNAIYLQIFECLMYRVDRSGHGTHSSSIGLGFETQERVVGGAVMCREFPAHTQDVEKRFDSDRIK